MQSGAQTVARLTREVVAGAYDVGLLIIEEERWLSEQLTRHEIALAKSAGDLAGKSRSELEDIANRLAKKSRAKDFEVYFEAKYADALPRELAERFTRLARRHEPQADAKAKAQVAFSFYDDPNLLRSGLLALRLFPAKRHHEVQGDASSHNPAPFLAAVNRFMALVRIERKQAITKSRASKLIDDLAPISAFLADLMRIAERPYPPKESL